MNNLSKVVLTGSIVLGAALFSIGCGGDSSCCEPTKPPKAIIGGFPSSGVLGANEHTLTINGTPSKDDGRIVAYEWTVDDVFASNQQSPTLDLGEPGRHKVCLKVTDNDNLTNMTCEYITVPALTGPTPIISPTTIKAGCPLDGSSSVSHSSSGEIREYKWTLNSLDAATVSTTAAYTVPNPTTATKVCLTVTDSNGESNGVCQDVVPHDAPTAVLHVFRDSNLNADIIKLLPIPIPPLEKQKEIVAILDKFDTLTNSISEGLPKEIELRQKQYEYYRELLLSFPKDN
jgi:hypothetical protein